MKHSSINLDEDFTSMKAKITSALVFSLAGGDKAYEVNDTDLRGFQLRILPSGTKTFLCAYRVKSSNKKNKFVIGKATVLSVAQARDEARKVLGDVARGMDPNAANRASRSATAMPTLEKFVDDDFSNWAKSHYADHLRVIKQIKAAFKSILKTKLDAISALQIEKWRAQCRERGLKATSVNRELASLRSCLSKAVEWDLLETHPLAKVKQSKVEDDGRVRYLSKQEHTALIGAIDDREGKFRAKRESHNRWLAQRGLPIRPNIPPEHFCDHLYPMVVLAMHTGLRRGELFKLKRGDVHFEQGQLKVRAAAAKSRKSRFVPLNSYALGVLTRWLTQSDGDNESLVFPGKEGNPMDNITSAWDSLRISAKLIDFHWHDFRHHFASMLVMAGVDLNTVRELLGHADLKMTLRYSHLAPEYKATAVEKLVRVAE
jgi:site-specific recombinase XerD